MSETRLITLDPGHFHAALVQKEMYPDVDRRVHVYAPLGPDLLAHLHRVHGFNTRREGPTAWDVEVHTGPDFLERLLHERPGNVVVLSGRNRNKIAYLRAAVRAGFHVLADKPWIIRSDDLPCLAETLDLADRNGLIAYDIMTERYEITSILQRHLVQDADILGGLEPGTPEEPGVFLESMHYLAKQVAGVPLRRPSWFFDIHQQGEGLTDVGTHLVDLVPWLLFPERPIQHEQNLQLLHARRWPTVLARDEFQRVTGERDLSAETTEFVQDGRLHYFCNTEIDYRLCGVHVRLRILWDYEAVPGAGDTHCAVIRGSRARVEVRQGAAEGFRPEVYVVPNGTGHRARLAAALKHRAAELAAVYPGVAVEDRGAEFRVAIPAVFRVGHEAHFGEVTRQFLAYLQAPDTLPAWEKPNLLAKYYLTTTGVERGRRHA
jgi:predicted dehydrogenase